MTIAEHRGYMWKYIGQTPNSIFPIFDFGVIWFFGHVETVPRHISKFQCLYFEKSIFLKACQTCRLEVDVCCRFQSPSKHPVVYVLAAGAFFRKTKAPGFWEHVLFVDFIYVCWFYCKLDVLDREMCQILETVFKKQLLCICPVVPPVPRKWWHEVLLGSSLPHAPGVRMTWVSQTPSNELISIHKLIKQTVQSHTTANTEHIVHYDYVFFS